MNLKKSVVRGLLTFELCLVPRLGVIACLSHFFVVTLQAERYKNSETQQNGDYIHEGDEYAADDCLILYHFPWRYGLDSLLQILPIVNSITEIMAFEK